MTKKKYFLVVILVLFGVCVWFSGCGNNKPVTVQNSGDFEPNQTLTDNTDTTTANPAEQRRRSDTGTADYYIVQELFNDINTNRGNVGKNPVNYDQSLEAAAIAYADELYQGGRAFRIETDYARLPSGDSVSTLLSSSGYQGPAGNFGYRVWKNDNAGNEQALDSLVNTVKNSDSYEARVINGDISRIGIAAAVFSETEDPYTVVIIMYL